MKLSVKRDIKTKILSNSALREENRYRVTGVIF